MDHVTRGRGFSTLVSAEELDAGITLATIDIVTRHDLALNALAKTGDVLANRVTDTDQVESFDDGRACTGDLLSNSAFLA